MFQTKLSASSASNGRKTELSEINYFYFRERRGHFDWRALAGVDVDKVMKEVDIDCLQAHLENLTFADVISERGHRYCDPEFEKIIRLCQLTIEYLIYVQNSSESEISQLGKKNETVTEENRFLKEEASRQATEAREMKKEIKRLKKSVAVYDLLLKLPANVRNLQANASAAPTSVHACSACGKSFSTATFLRSHMERRHSKGTFAESFVPQTSSLESSLNSGNTTLGTTNQGTQELRELREQLLSETQKIKNYEKELKEKLEQTLVKERESAISKEQEFQQLHQQQRLRHEEELRSFQAAMRKEFFDQKDIITQQERRIEQLQQIILTRVGSGLGTQLVDEEPTTKKGNDEDTFRLKLQQEFQEKTDEILKKQAEEYERKLTDLQKMMEKQQNKVQKKKNKAAPSIAVVASEEEPKTVSKQHYVEPPTKKPKTEKKQQREILIQEASDSEPEPVAGSYNLLSDFPEITSRFPHTPQVIEKQKIIVSEKLKRELMQRKIPADSNRMSDHLYQVNMQLLSEAQQRAGAESAIAVELEHAVSQILSQHKDVLQPKPATRSLSRFSETPELKKSVSFSDGYTRK